jgi:hypothetical protein
MPSSDPAALSNNTALITDRWLKYKPKVRSEENRHALGLFLDFNFIVIESI